MEDNLLQDITIYHNSNNTWIRYNLKASVRNTFNKNRDNTGSNNVNRALIRIFDVKGYKSTYNIQDGDLTDSEKQNLSDLLKNLEKEKNKNIINNKEILDENELNQIKDDYELGDEIITLLSSEINKKKKEKENINKRANKLKIRRYIYIPGINIKGKINPLIQR